jgi:hypothetical protein
VTIGSAQFDDPPTVWTLSGEMHLQRERAGVGGKRGVERATRVDHEGIALLKKRADLAELRVGDLRARSPRDQEAYAVAANATRFGRLTRLQLRGQVKVERQMWETRLQPLGS